MKAGRVDKGAAGASADSGGAKPAPRVRVVMPAYNVARYLGEALDSAFAQTYGDFEVIVVNDGSPDTEALERALARYRGRVNYIVQENRGVGAARNTAIRAARGELIALLDPDDVWEPDYLAVQVAALDADPSAAVVYPDALLFGDAPEAGRRYMALCPTEGEVTVEGLLRGRCNVMGTVTARREALVRAGLYDEGLRPEDFDLWLRLLKGGGRIIYHRQVLVRYRRHGESHSVTSPSLGDSILRVLEKAERTLGLTPGEREALEVMRDNVRARVALHEGRKAFFRGDPAAAQHLAAANRYLKSRKLGLVIFLLRLAPGWLRLAYNLRDRLIWRANTKV